MRTFPLAPTLQKMAKLKTSPISFRKIIFSHYFALQHYSKRYWKNSK